MTKISDEHFEGIYKALAKIADEAQQVTGNGVLIAIGMRNGDETAEGVYATSLLEWADACKLAVGISAGVSEHYGDHGDEHGEKNND